MGYIKGNFNKYIFKSDSGYVVGLFKVRETDMDIKDRSVVFTGYFTELNEVDIYKFEGSFVNHPKYGNQFNVSSYEIILPDDKDHIIDFLSSSLFKGIGKKKASKIVETLGENCLNIIANDYDILLTVPTVTKKQRDIIYDTIISYKSSYEDVMKLIKLGFNMQDALRIQNYYGKLEDVLENPYSLIENIKDITFPKLEKIRNKLNVDLDNVYRISYGIIYVMEYYSFNSGNTYMLYDELMYYTSKLLNVSSEDINNGITNLIKENKLLIDENKYYLVEVYNSEKYIANRINLLTRNYENLNYDKYLNELEDQYKVTFNKEQKEAITSALNNKISIITGGPGTGKTTIIKAITDLYQKVYGLSREKLINDVVLLAPTGRASKRMSNLSFLPSYTIHRFLKWNKENNTFLINEENKSNVKFAIIDEASMLDTELFYNLLLGLEATTKIVLIGDYNQLPSVGPGQVLKDIILSDIVPCTYLKKLYRQKEGSNINLLAEGIPNKEIDFSLFNSSDDLEFISCNSNNLKETLKEYIKEYKNMSIYDIIVLAPLYKGDNGIDGLNLFIQDILNKKSNKKNELIHNGTFYREGDKVLHLINNVEDNVFNGDIGEIIRINNNKEVVFDFDGNLVVYETKDLDNVRLGYTISVHKGQGSEFSVVIIPILNNYNIMLYNKLIYTAITRAKTKLILLGEESAFKRAVLTDKDDNRRTSLKNFLIDSIK